MSCVKVPNTRLYWSCEIGQSTIQQAFSVNRWEEIKGNLHFNSNINMLPRDDPNFDRLFKIRPLLEAVRDRFRTIPKDEMLCIDEQIIPTKGRTSFLQYNKDKPHKWGYKVLVLCGQSGINYDFELYCGKDGKSSVLPHEPELGMSANIIVRLSRTIPRAVNHKLFLIIISQACH